MLPSPTVPLPRRGMTAAELEAVVGSDLAAPLREAEYALTRAEQVVRELNDRRPGDGSTRGDGSVWREAVRADAEAAARGEQPGDGWRVAELLVADPDRYAEALAAVGAVPLARARAEQAVDRSAITDRATQVAAEASARWAEAAEAGWRAREDRTAAWQHRSAGDSALATSRRAIRVVGWADRRPVPGSTGAPGQRVDLAGASLLPELPAARGYWLALGLFLDEGRTTWLEVPTGVTWPEDMPERLIDAVMAEPGQASGLLREGVAVPGYGRPRTATANRLNQLRH